MVKRKLNDDEIRLSKLNLASLKEDIKYDEAMVKYYTLQVEELLPLNLSRKMKEFKDLIKQLNNEITVANNIIIEVEKQINEGVDIKDEKSINKEE